MSSGETWGLIGGLAGGLLGLVGGLIGTYYSIRNTESSRERSCVIRSSILCWAAIGLFLGLMWLLPVPYRYFLWIPYSMLVPWGIMAANRKQQRIRAAETQQGREKIIEAHTHENNIHG